MKSSQGWYRGSTKGASKREVGRRRRKRKRRRRGKRKRRRKTRRKSSETEEDTGIKWKNLPLDESGTIYILKWIMT